MHLPKPHFNPLPLAYRILGVVLVACFLLIGIAGLILPIIPGLVFLFLAAYVLTRVSKRAAAFAHNQPWIARHLRKVDATNNLTVGERCKLALLIVAQGVVDGVRWCAGLIKGPNR